MTHLKLVNVKKKCKTMNGGENMKAIQIQDDAILIDKVATTIPIGRYVLLRQRVSGYTPNLWRIPKVFCPERVTMYQKKAWLNIKSSFAKKFRSKGGFIFTIWRIRSYAAAMGLTVSPIFLVQMPSGIKYYYLVITTAEHYRLLKGGNNAAA
jgi:hypothetical protein